MTWFEFYLAPSSFEYRFTDSYVTLGNHAVEIRYTLPDDSPALQTFGPYSAGSSTLAINFTLPVRKGGTPITIEHLSTESITVNTKSLYNYGSGYMNLAQAMDLQSAGHEIGGHTRNHCNLVRIFNDSNAASSVDTCAFTMSNTTPAFQVDQADLRAMLASPFDTFAYPNGAWNESIKTTVHNAGYSSARSVDLGYNTKRSDKYALKVQIVDASTTLPMVKSWIDTAYLNKTWLISVFHQISYPLTIDTNV